MLPMIAPRYVSINPTSTYVNNTPGPARMNNVIAPNIMNFHCMPACFESSIFAILPAIVPMLMKNRFTALKIATAITNGARNPAVCSHALGNAVPYAQPKTTYRYIKDPRKTSNPPICPDDLFLVAMFITS